MNLRTNRNPSVQENYSDSASEYAKLGEGYIHPKQIMKNGNSLFNFIREMAKEVNQLENNVDIARGYGSSDLIERQSFSRSRIPELYNVGKNMQRQMNEGYRERIQQEQYNKCIQVPLEILLNADKFCQHSTEGNNKTVYKNDYKKEDTKTMSDIDISEYLGNSGGAQRKPQNNTFYINMDKTTKGILVEQQKTNKLLGILIQTVRDNGIKIEELPQHLTEVIEAGKIDNFVETPSTYDELSDGDDSLLLGDE